MNSTKIMGSFPWLYCQRSMGLLPPQNPRFYHQRVANTWRVGVPAGKNLLAVLAPIYRRKLNKIGTNIPPLICLLPDSREKVVSFIGTRRQLSTHSTCRLDAIFQLREASRLDLPDLEKPGGEIAFARYAYSCVSV